MHIVRTAVSRGSSDGVAFEGEGGETVTVTLSGREQQTDEELVETARAVLLQVARFGMPEEFSVPAGGSHHRYALEYRDKDAVLTIPPVDLPNLAAVRAEIRQSAKDLWKDALSNSESPTGWAVRARDETGAIVASIDFEEVRHEPVE